MPQLKQDNFASNGKLRFDVYEADPRAGELRKHGYRIRLEDRPFRALLILLQRANEVVTREELQKQLWPADVFIDFDNGLNTAVGKIRRALNDSADQPRFVETVGRRGYRFIAPVLTDGQPVSTNGERGNGHVAGFEEFSQADRSATSSLPSEEDSIAQSRTEEVGWKQRRFRFVIAGLMATVIAGGGFAMYRLSHKGSEPAFDSQQMQIRQVTEHGLARFASISRDGRYVVYVKTGGINPSLRALQIATGSDIEVVPPIEGSFLSTISFSADTNYVYFGHNSRDNPAVFDLFSVPILGGTVQRVLSDIAGASVSPDGTRIAFVRRDPVNARTMLMVANSDGSEQRELAARTSKRGFMGDMPAWSPSGKLVAVVAIHDGNEAVREIVVVPVSGGEPRSLLGTRTFGQIAWLNEQGLLVASFDFSVGFAPGSGRAQLWYYPYPDGKALRFSNDTSHYTQVGITAARDGVVSVKQDLSNEVYVASAAKPGDMRPITHERISGFDVDWIGAGRLLVRDENHHVYTMNADGSNRVVLFDKFSAENVGSCGDNAVVFNRTDPNNIISLSVLELSRGTIRSLVRGPYNMGASCSPDGKWVYYTAYGETPVRIMKIPATGGNAVPVGPPASQDPVVSPDGKLVLFRMIKGQGSARHAFLAVMSPTDGSILQKWPMPTALGVIGWGPCCETFVYTHREKSKVALWQQPLGRAEARPVPGTEFTGPAGIWSFAYSPDGTRLALIRGTETRDVVLFTNFHK